MTVVILTSLFTVKIYPFICLLGGLSSHYTGVLWEIWDKCTKLQLCFFTPCSSTLCLCLSFPLTSFYLSWLHPSASLFLCDLWVHRRLVSSVELCLPLFHPFISLSLSLTTTDLLTLIHFQLTRVQTLSPPTPVSPLSSSSSSLS